MKKLVWFAGGAASLVVCLALLTLVRGRVPSSAPDAARQAARVPLPPALAPGRSKPNEDHLAATAQGPSARSDAARPSCEPLDAFLAWAEAYATSPGPERAAMEAEGLMLAKARRPVFKQLIRENPRRALAEALPMVLRQELSPEILTLLEERVNGRAALRVYQGVGPDNRSPVPTVRIAEFQTGRTYQAYVYGRRAEQMQWLAGASLNGVAVDQEFAVNEDPFRILEIGERPDPLKPAITICPVSGESSLATEAVNQPITEESPALEAFGEIVFLCDGSHTTVYRQLLIQAEGASGGPMTFTGILPAAPTPSIGNVRVLVIPLTFADQNDTPSSESVLYQLMRDVGDHYAKASYGKLTLLTTVTPPVKVPHNESWYIQKDSSNGGPIDGLGLAHSHARAEARKMGFDDAEFDCVVVRLRGGARPAGGYGGGSSVWIYGDGADVTAHEIGHAFGLGHANFWQTSGTSAIGAGANEEYGGHWDVMGGIGLPYGHYNVQGKNQIRWLPDAFVTEITSSGLYRVHAQDQPILDPAKRYALRVRKDSLHTYWGEIRGLYSGHATRTWADFGFILGWRYPGGGGGNWQLIDTTPGSPFGKDDSPVSLGRTFSDMEAGIHFTTLAVNAATEEEPKSVDIMVHIGDTSGNRPPTLALAASGDVVPLNVPVTFAASASDPDGDALAFSWQHFGDANYRSVSPNSPVITRSFPSAGTYVVTCVVSDMKGGSATRNVLLTVGNGGGRYTISGQVTLEGRGLPGVLVNANSANGVITDSDGRYVIPNLAAGTYVITPLLHGYSFNDLFNNSVTLGPDFAGADFDAAPVPRVSLTTTAPSCSESNTAVPAVLTLTRKGDTAQALTVNVIGPTGTAIRNTDYTLAPAPGTGAQGYSTLTFAAEEESLTVTVAPVNDSSSEGPETVTLELAPGNGYLMEGFARATVAINDDDTALPKVSLVVGAAKTVEGSPAAATVVFSRSGSTTGALVVAYTVGGTASGGTDYTPLNGTLTIPAGAAADEVAVLSLDDTKSEQLETVTLTLAGGATFMADPVASTATLFIVDDDVQVLTVVASDAVATERDLRQPEAQADTATFLVSRTGDNSEPLTMYYAVSGINTGTVATALHGVDYEALPGVLTLPAGQAIAAVTIIPRWDGLGEGPESVTLQLGAGPTQYRLGNPNSATITIQDAGDPPYVEVLGIDNAIESGTAGRFRFSLKGSAAGNVAVNYTVSGTATSGTDYTALPGSVTIPANGVNTVEVSVTPINDTFAEDLETITVSIVPSSAYQIFVPSSSATLWLRDDEQPTLFVDATTSSYPPSFAENGSGASFYISRVGPSNTAVTVNYSMSGTAVNGTDYQLLTGTTNLSAGALGVDIPVIPINDTLAEGVETVTLSLAPGAYGRGAPATFHLTDNETPAVTVGFASSNGAGPESDGVANIEVALSAASAAPVTVEYLVDSGSRAASTASGIAPSPLPYWVRCERIHDLVVGSISSDGVAWTSVSTQTVAMASASYLAGLHVCSFNASTLSTSIFDNVSISGLQPGGTVGALAGGNIGSTAVGGSVSVASGIYTVAGAGDNVEGTTDQGYFAWWPINNSTNCIIIARVVSEQNTSPLATAGVMIRESTANNVRRAYMAATPASGFEFHYRSAPGASETKATAPPPPHPLWVRVHRAGSVLSTFQSGDGDTWTQVGVDLDMGFGPEVLAGLAVSSQAEGTLATATIDNVSLSPGPSPALPGRTVGFTSFQGTDGLTGGVYTITASADGLNGTHDDCHFLAAPITGDFTLTARVRGMQTTAANPQAGVLVRESTKRSSRMVFLGGYPGSAPQLVWRTTTTTAANGMGIDYTLASGLLTFAPGITTQSIRLDITNDSLSEPDEPVTVVLRNVGGARLGSVTQFTYLIVDDDSPPALPFAGFATVASSAPEGSGIAWVPVVLSVPAVVPATLDYMILPGTATPGSDFLVATGTLHFAVGDTVQSLPVALVDDQSIEPARTIFLTLSNAANLRLSTLTNQTLTILDDDSPVVTISSVDTNASEAGDSALVTITRTGSTESNLTVSLSRAGTATPTIDYAGIGSSTNITAGEASVTLVLAPIQDATSEGTETAIISLAARAGYVIGASSNLTCLIADDDRNTVTIVATQPSATEGGGAGLFTVERIGNTAGTLGVNLTITGTATSSSDFTTVPSPLSPLSFAAGQTTRTITINPIDDSTTEGNEAVLVQLNPGQYDVGGVGYASVTLIDNDIPPTVFISSPGAQGVVVAPGNGVELVATADDDGLPLPLTYQWTQITGPGTVAFGASAAAATPAMFSAPGTYLLRVTVSDGEFAASDQIAVTLGGGTNLAPADWFSTDIGPPTLAGFSGVAGSNWVLSAVGAGYTSDSDRAHAVTRQVTGNGALVARLTALSGPAAAEAGLSVRDSMHRYSRRAALVYQGSSRTLRFRPRVTNHATDFSVAATALNLPLWLKLERLAASNTVAAFYATDSGDVPGPWIQLGTNVVIAMDAAADYSLTADSGSDTVAAIAGFDRLSLTPAPGAPAELAEDFGDGAQAGNYAYDPATDTHTVRGQGSLDGSGMFWGKLFTGDFILTALQTDATSNGNDSRSGIMIRDSMDNGPMAFVGRNPQGAFSSFVWRTNPKGGTSGLNGITQKRRWLRFIRRGSQVTALHAPDSSGVPGAWVQLGLPQTVFLQPTVMAGLYCDNAGGVGLNTATFTKFSVVPVNRAPVVDAGSAPANPFAPMTLSGTVTDDALPRPFTAEWTVPAAPGPVTFADSSAPVTTASFTMAGDYTLRLWAEDGIARSFDDLSFSFTASPFQTWQSVHFAGGSANPEAAADADPDADGLKNVTEYGLGTNPNVAGPSPVVVSLVTLETDQYLRVSIPRNPQATDATLTVETSPEVAPATWSSAGVHIEENTTTLLQARSTTPTSAAPRQFFRVEFSLH